MPNMFSCRLKRKHRQKKRKVDKTGDISPERSHSEEEEEEEHFVIGGR